MLGQLTRWQARSRTDSTVHSTHNPDSQAREHAADIKSIWCAGCTLLGVQLEVGRSLQEKYILPVEVRGCRL